MKKITLKALIFAFLLGFVFGPAVIDFIFQDRTTPENEVSLTKEPTDWLCLFGFKCYTE